MKLEEIKLNTEYYRKKYDLPDPKLIAECGNPLCFLTVQQHAGEEVVRQRSKLSRSRYPQGPGFLEYITWLIHWRTLITLERNRRALEP